MLKIQTSCQNIMLKNIAAMLKIQKWSYMLCSKVEIYSQMQQFKTLQPYTELRITAGPQTNCRSDHFSEMSGKISLFQHDVLTSVMPHCEHWILIQQKLDVLVAFSNSVLHVSLQPEFMFWTSELVSRDINFVSIFIQFVCPYLCSVFQFEVKDFCGLTPMHI